MSVFKLLYRLPVASAILICGLLMMVKVSQAQEVSPDISPGTTLGTIVEHDASQENFVIHGGIRTNDPENNNINLFHSFEEFSIPLDGSASFIEIDDVNNIVGRVTGENISDINGTIIIDSNIDTNLFLINSNGIIFGPGASLDIEGSLITSTASGIRFDDGIFSIDANRTIDPLLLVNVPIGLQFGNRAEPIYSQSRSRLEVQPGKTIALVGGEIVLDGVNLTDRPRRIFVAPGGRIELGSVIPNSYVTFQNNGNWELTYEEEQDYQNIDLRNGASLLTSYQNIALFESEPSGPIQIRGQNITLSGSSIDTSNEDIFSVITGEPSKGGDISIFATGFVRMLDSNLFALNLITNPLSSSGNITIEANQLILEDSMINVVTDKAGRVGNINLNVNEHVHLLSQSRIDAATLIEGDDQTAGVITVDTRELLLEDGSQISSSTFGDGNASILHITADDSITIRGINGENPSGLFSVTTRGRGDAGNISVTTGTLAVEDSGQISVRSNLEGTEGNGRAGELMISADSIYLDTDAEITASTESSGIGGQIMIDTEQLFVQGGARISAETSGQGSGGQVIVNADLVELTGVSETNASSGLFTITTGTGDGGGINLATGQLIVREGATISTASINTVDSEEPGNAGDLNIRAIDLSLNNQGSLITTTDSGRGGDMALNISDVLLLRNASQIATTAGLAGAGGDGGNIDLDAGFVIAVPNENSDIIANAFSGTGGTIEITSNQLLGFIEQRGLTNDQLRINSSSDLSASSQIGQQGEIIINNLAFDPNQGLVELPTISPPSQVQRGCSADLVGTTSFTVTGQGGLPPSPTDILSRDQLLTDLGPESRISNSLSNIPINEPITVTSNPLIEARALVKQSDGRIFFVSQSSTATPHLAWQQSTQCSGHSHP